MHLPGRELGIAQTLPPLALHASTAEASAAACVPPVATPVTNGWPPPTASAAQLPLPENSCRTVQAPPPQRSTAAALACAWVAKLTTMAAEGREGSQAMAPYGVGSVLPPPQAANAPAATAAIPRSLKSLVMVVFQIENRAKA
jgi:hypothetical protein